jgi:hypothetical protein
VSARLDEAGVTVRHVDAAIDAARCGDAVSVRHAVESAQHVIQEAAAGVAGRRVRELTARKVG